MDVNEDDDDVLFTQCLQLITDQPNECNVTTSTLLNGGSSNVVDVHPDGHGTRIGT